MVKQLCSNFIKTFWVSEFLRDNIFPTFRSEKLITMLKSQGFRASRTHFDPTAIRTDANISQMMQVMNGEQVKK